MRTIIVLPHDPLWEKEFDRLQKILANALGDCVVRLEHVGSTAVPGLWAKPILDIDIVLPDFSRFREAESRLAAIGCMHEDDGGIPGRERFSWPAEGLRRHIYVCPSGGEELTRHLALRDFLRRNGEYRAKYTAVKREMAFRHPHDIDAYIAGKEAVVREIYEHCGLPPFPCQPKKWRRQRNKARFASISSV